MTPTPEPADVDVAGLQTGAPRRRGPRRAVRAAGNPAEPAGPPATGAAEPPVLPDRTVDETDVGWGSPWRDDPDDDDRFLRERPPHWQ